jgi:hypothetical protein
VPVEWIPRKYRRLYLGTKCEDCGITQVGLQLEYEKASLQLHHRDSNRKNNTKENFATLCGPCHTQRHWDEGEKYGENI